MSYQKMSAAEIKALCDRLRAERIAAKPQADRDLLQRQRDARVNSVMRSGRRQRNFA